MTLSFDSMRLGNEQSSYGYNHLYSSHMWSTLKIYNQDGLFNILVCPQSQVSIDMSLHILEGYSSSWTN